MWNRVLTSEEPRFNTAPNAFLVRMVEGREPGRALDVGMDDHLSKPFTLDTLEQKLLEWGELQPGLASDDPAAAAQSSSAASH